MTFQYAFITDMYFLGCLPDIFRRSAYAIIRVSRDGSMTLAADVPEGVTHQSDLTDVTFSPLLYMWQ